MKNLFIKCLAPWLLLSASLGAQAQISAETVLQAGDGYQLKKVDYIDEKGQSRSAELYYIHNIQGATNAYLDAGLPLEELIELQEEVSTPWGPIFGRSARNTTQAEQYTWVIDKRGASMQTEAEGQDYINEFGLHDIVAAEEAVSEGDIPELAAADHGRFLGRVFKRCRGWRSRTKTFRKSFDENLNYDKTIGNQHANMHFKGDLDLDVDVELNLGYEYRRNFACIPYKFRYRSLSTKGNYDVSGDFEVTGVAQHNFGNHKWQIARPQVLDAWFMVGPVPVRIAAKIPIEVGTGDIVIKATGQVKLLKPIDIRGHFHYNCDRRRCTKVSANHRDNFSDLRNHIGASLSASLTLKPYLHVAARPYLYGEWFLYAQVGVKPSFPIEVFGYYGNLCEDGNNDGMNEWVSAGLGTLSFEAGITAEAKFFNRYLLSPQYHKIWEKPILLVDFLNPSSAFSPVLKPHVDVSTRFVRLPLNTRSCISRFTNKFPRDYQIDWGDGNKSNVNDVRSLAEATHQYAHPGSYLVKVTSKKGASTSVVVSVNDGWGPIF